ncbi:FtsW/RodA/SpoVE family cell cycle protein [Neoehrlichia mikurensis]|uniref:Probable peptidoglycan glycosyltransferase FtsW n=1 Tax=Neoehrlichia mikurensis TaxID=89586 RepID=A0A9Q9BT98_9RICK|nr:FtsW/RodA/SpoVE family cell cycle protein [Neoehrlichia mikurensis]QXK92330.1 FtsW/RodA/SpoVE family cell cycle protein [Neoehrlichia mikurensis]QXK92784.1 FtsW/RodA/SpoVE family cell cycle protein [Neoehrlichia mikurensis]QXK94025.1 FtsW/RodA/SpoVE family cell cycle protein [Neoehrlichia mikurensis]UTO55810.1 FtsW/RodA/SpoVE family cell cycle protein [Neoehrlichia mikurensis]UTO56725.1 FtsW/RodA/SpoVE family cell cycle protein [Neoehrlichia mikurensis]
MKVIDSSIRGLFNSWYRTVDKSFFFSIIFMLVCSLVLISSAGPVIEKKILLPQNYFISRHLLYMLMSLCIIILCSLINYYVLTRMSFIGLFFVICILVYMFFFGIEVKGSKRWLYIFGASIQPSEFAKPLFVIVTAYILCSNIYYKYYISFCIYFILVTLLLLQPDFSMSIILSITWILQLFLCGINYLYFFIIGSILLLIVFLCCYFTPYVRNRIYVFFDPLNHDNFQISKSIQSFKIGKITGVGPGEGIVKLLLPDCHTDFIFSVAAEEFGIICCLLILLVFGYISAKMWYFTYKESDMFRLLTIAGLFFQFSTQFLVNIGVVLNLLPTTGLSLPLLSYGGSSLLSISFLLGSTISFNKGRLAVKRIIVY